MTKFKVVAKAQITGWDETPLRDSDGAVRLARAAVTQKLSGDADGVSTVEYLMVHREDQTASFVGFERFEGALRDRFGSFVLRTEGAFEGGVASGSFEVVPGSGTGELAVVIGAGGFRAPDGRVFEWFLEYKFSD